MRRGWALGLAWLVGSRRGQPRRTHRARRRERPFRRLSVERLEDRSLLAATLVGTVWHDLNSDGQQSGGEPAVEYAVAELFSSTNGTIGDSDDVSLGTRITDSAGNYQFTGLAAGVNHFVVIRPPVGFAFTTQDTGPDATDSDVSATGISAMFAPVDLSTVDLDAGLTGAAPAFGWAARQGGTGTDEGRSVAVDGAGNPHVTGRFNGTVDFDPGPGTYNLTSGGVDDVFIAKFAPSGALVWARRIGGSSTGDIGNDVAIDGSGDVLVTGSFQGTVDFDPGAGTANLTSAGGMDAFVLKLNADGNYVWAWTAGSTSNDDGRSVAVDAANQVSLTGYFQGTVDFDPGGAVVNLTSAGSLDAFVLKLDAAGNHQWARAIGGASADIGYGVAVDAVGNTLIAGHFEGTVDFDPGAGVSNLTTAGFGDAFVLKLDGAGNFEWARAIGGSGVDEARGVAVDGGGNVVVTGDFEGTVDFDPGAGVANLTSAGSVDAYVLKLDAAGSYVWARRFGNASAERANGVAVDAADDVYVAGHFIGTVDFDPGLGVSNLTTAGVDDVYVLKLDAAGNYRRARRAGGTNTDLALGVAVDAAGKVLVTGYFQGTADLDPGSATFNLTSAGGRDNFLWRVMPVLFVSTRVTGVYVRGTGDASGTGNDEWLAAYLTHLGAQGLGDAALGYRVSVGADQLDALPWTNVDTISIRFSEGVTIASGHLQVIGAAEGPAVPTVGNFNYNASTFTATWQFATALPASKYLLHFATGVVVGPESFALDGEWTDGVSTQSGNGSAGGAFSFRLNVVPGDTNGDTATTQSVTNADVLLTKQALSTDVSAGAAYLFRRDVNASGAITNADVLQAKQRLSTSIFDYTDPEPPPPGESFGEESLAAARLTEPWHTEIEPWHTETSSTDAALAEPVPLDGPIDLEAWDAAILAMYGQTKK